MSGNKSLRKGRAAGMAPAESSCVFGKQLYKGKWREILRIDDAVVERDVCGARLIPAGQKRSRISFIVY
jgi:hypothetical protein